MVKVLGIDASTRCTGYAIVSEDGKLWVHGVVNWKHEQDIDVRIDNMILALIKIIDLHKPDIVYIEDSWKGGQTQNIQTTKKLTNIIGAVRCLSLQNGCIFNSVYPSTWRSAIGIDGGKGTKRDEFKQRAIDWVSKKYGHNVSDDEAEAICIAYAGNIINNSMFEEDLF